jgi:alcohol dehydrogenase
VDASSTPTLMRLVASGQLDVARFVTHRFGMNDFERAYDLFGDAASNGALKAVLTREEENEEDDYEAEKDE